MSRIGTFLLIFVLSFAFSIEANGQSRPYDNTEIMVLSPRGLQSDSYFSSSNKNDQTNLSTQLRYGLSKNFELQMTWSSDKFKFSAQNVVSEVTTIGVKMHLTNNSKFIPALSLIASSNLTFDPDQRLFLPTLNLLYEKSLTNSININGNYKASIDEKNGDFITDYAFNLEADITDWQTTYVGLTGNSAFFRESDYEHYLEIGMLFWVYKGITLYPYYDIGLTDGTGDRFSIGALFTLK